MADQHNRASLIHPDSVWPVSCTELEGTYKRYACNMNAYGMYILTRGGSQAYPLAFRCVLRQIPKF